MGTSRPNGPSRAFVPTPAASTQRSASTSPSAVSAPLNRPPRATRRRAAVSSRYRTPARSPAARKACSAAIGSACPSLAQNEASRTAGPRGAASLSAAPSRSSIARPRARWSFAIARIVAASPSSRARRRLPVRR